MAGGPSVRASGDWTFGGRSPPLERGHFTGSQAAQLLWLRENEPESLQKAHVIFHAKDWLFYKLTGLMTSDETDELLTMLRMATRKYDADLFKIFGIEELYSKFPPVKPTVENVGTLVPKVAVDLDLPKGINVGSGPMDVAACALGTGAIEHGQASSILGTAGIHEVVMQEPLLAPRMVRHHPLPRRQRPLDANVGSNDPNAETWIGS